MDDQGHDNPTLVGSSKTPELKITTGEDVGETYQIKPQTRIGRERDNDVILLDPRASRYHAQISFESGQWTVQDLGSSNQTYLNGEPVSEAMPLKSGDRIGIGETEFTFSIPGTPVAETAPAAAVTPVPPTTAPTSTAPARNAPPRLAWIAGGFVLLLCLVAVFAIYMISRDTAEPEETPSNISDAPPSGPGTGSGATAIPVTVPPAPENLTLIYEDDFSDSFGGWDDAFDSYTTKQYGNNRYQIEVSTDNLIAWGMANRDVADFDLEVEARQEDGAKSNSYGLLFRLQDRDNFYRYDVSGDGFFLLSKFEDGQWHTLIDWTQSDFINPDTNILKVSAFGSDVTVWANGQALGSVTDDSFEHGNFGFFASTFSEPYMWVSFDNLKLLAPEGQQLTMLPTSTRAIVPLVDTSSSPLATPTNTPPPASDTVSVIATPTGEAVAEASESPTPSATFTSTPRPTRTPTPTPVPLPEYASRDQPLARGEAQVTGRIVFPVYDVARGTYDIYMANAANGSNRQLVQAQASQPGLTVDGKDIAYRSWQPDNRGLFARLLDGGEVWKFELFFESARPQYSPVDNSLMYHSRTSGEEPAVYRVVDGVGQVMRGDGAPVQGRNPKWTPDAQQIVYNACLGGTCGVVRRDADGTDPIMLTDHPSDTTPEVSPDGNTVVFMSQRSGDWDVYSVSINGGEIRALTDDDSSDGLPTWSPDGNKVAFVSNRDGEWSIWDMDPNGTNERRLFELDGSIDGQVLIDVANSYGWVEENIDWIP